MPVRPPIFRANGVRVGEYSQQRGSPRAHGYTKQWDLASRAFKREHPLCLGCQAVGRVEATAVTDHVLPHRGDMSLFWDSTRWQPACGWHHNVVKQRLEVAYENAELSEADLWLNSSKAIALTRRLWGRGG